MKIPEKIKIGGKTYTVEITDKWISVSIMYRRKFSTAT